MLHVADNLEISLLKLKLFWSFQPQDVSMNNEVQHLLHSESKLWWKKKKQNGVLTFSNADKI